MKIPKYIEKLLKRRTKLAYDLIAVGCKLDDWLQKNSVSPDSACWSGGAAIYVEPDVAENAVVESILNK